MFSSDEAAQDFLSLSPLGEGLVRQRLLRRRTGLDTVAFHEGVKDILLDPLPGHFLAKVALTSLVGREHFIESLIES